MGPISVFARWRPLEQSEAEVGEINRKTLTNSSNLLSVTISRPSLAKSRPWTSSAAFHSIFDPEHHNRQVYEAVVAPNIPKMLRGENCSLFAYDHSGSGKTYTMMGYDFQNTEELGLCLAAGK